jgi:hypothetical protein
LKSSPKNPQNREVEDAQTLTYLVPLFHHPGLVQPKRRAKLDLRFHLAAFNVHYRLREDATSTRPCVVLLKYRDQDAEVVSGPRSDCRPTSAVKVDEETLLVAATSARFASIRHSYSPEAPFCASRLIMACLLDKLSL